MPIRFFSKLTRAAGLVFCLAAVTACVADTEDDGPTEEAVDEVEQAFGEATCATMTPSAIYTGFVPAGGYASPQAYDSVGCYKARAVQIDDYSPFYVGAAWAFEGGLSASWDDAVLSTKSSCESAYLRGDLYRYYLGRVGWTLVGSSEAFGTWLGSAASGRCEPPVVGFANRDPGPDLLVAGAKYKLVATARTHNSSSAQTRKFRVVSTLDNKIE